MKLVKTLSILLVIVIVFGSAMFALNLYTGPIIEANNAGAANDRLNAAMPGGAGYEDITATLSDLPDSVSEVYRETSGLGYVIVSSGATDYSTLPLVVVVGVSLDGKICGINVDSYGDAAGNNWNSKLTQDYLATYIGQDSALADVGLVAGVTYSSTAFKSAVSDAMGVLIANDMIQAGVKSDLQILTELVPTVAPGFVKPTEDASASGNIQLVLKADNGAGFAYVMGEGDASFLAVVNAMGACKIYDVEGTDVTAAHDALVAEAKAHASANQTNYLTALENKIGRVMADATDITALELDTFSSIVSAVSFKVGDVTYYGFYSRTYGFHQMDVFFIIDENGAVAKMDANQFIFEQEYFFGFGGMNVTEYKNGFVGMTYDTWTGDQAIIATATMTSNAMKQSTTDVFAAFDSVKGGEAQ